MTLKTYKNIALIVAGGNSRRMGIDIPKQYIKVKDKTILAHTLEKFYDHPKIDGIICVIAEDMAQTYTESVTPHHKLLPFVFGGNTRQKSVYAGLYAAEEYTPNIILIHDAARPNVMPKTIDNLLSSLEAHDGACPALPITDSLRRQNGANIDREGVFYVQTPQAFKFKKIIEAHIYCEENTSDDFTDDISIAHHFGLRTVFCAGDQNNYKITTQQDLSKFMQFCNPLVNLDVRTGNGYDVHRIVPGDGMTLGGIKIDCPFKLKGHSDADVVLHAVTDAILGTICADDIGAHFNPNDPQWAGKDSAIFLKDAHQRLCAENGFVNFLDITIICEKPKIGPHRLRMRENIAHILEIPLNRVSIKATTTEKLGFTGRQEGIAVQATVTVMIR